MIQQYLYKTLSYRLITTLLSVLIMGMVTGNYKFSIAFGAIELIVKPIIYLIHEIVWHKWGKLH